MPAAGRPETPPPHAQLVGNDEARRAFNLEGMLVTGLVLLADDFSSSSSDDLFWG